MTLARSSIPGLSARGLLTLAVAGALAACAPQPSPTRAEARAVTADCQARADAVYSQQNRADLSRRDQKDSPFAESYNSGITSAGLGARYSYDRMVASCVAANRAGAPAAAGTGPTFTGPQAQ